MVHQASNDEWKKIFFVQRQNVVLSHPNHLSDELLHTASPVEKGSRFVRLTLSCKYWKNCQAYFKILVVFTLQNFQSIFGHFLTLFPTIVFFSLDTHRVFLLQVKLNLDLFHTNTMLTASFICTAKYCQQSRRDQACDVFAMTKTNNFEVRITNYVRGLFRPLLKI